MEYRPDGEIEPFWGHWTTRDEDLEPQHQAEAEPWSPAEAEPWSPAEAEPWSPAEADSPAEAEPWSPAGAKHAPRGSWLSSRWFGGCLAAAAALGLCLGIWALFVAGSTQVVRRVNTVRPRASTVTRYMTRRVRQVVPQPALAPAPVTEWATAAAPPPDTVTMTPPDVTVTARVPVTVPVSVPVTVPVRVPATVTVSVPVTVPVRVPATVTVNVPTTVTVTAEPTGSP